jgi:hypothetical protein
MDQSTPQGSLPSADEEAGEKRPWARPSLTRLDVGLTAFGSRTHARASDYYNSRS